MRLVAHVGLHHLTGRLVDHPLIHLSLAAHHCLAEAPRPGDEQVPDLSGDRVDGEGHPGHLGVDHLLDHHRHVRCGELEPLFVAVAHRPVLPEGRPAPLHVLQGTLRSAHPEEGIVLTGEGRPRQIFQCGRRAHAHRAG